MTYANPVASSPLKDDPQPVHSHRLRSGFTTGACAAAAARAATRALITGQPVEAIAVDLPARRGVVFPIHRCDVHAGQATCSVIKDAGDDPDVTHGAEIVATVEWNEMPGITLRGGKGVGIVTRPGLELEVGEPAINPAPRRMITQAVTAELGTNAKGVTVTISVPQGEQLAVQTLNPRLGILGGISILGTNGIVRPYSQTAYRATIHLALKVAAANGAPCVVLSTGARSEAWARAHYPHLPELSFIEVGDHIGYALRQTDRLGIFHVVIAGMVGKLSKVAQGRWQTHVNQGGVDLDFMASLAAQLGADEDLVARCRTANTARHVQVLLRRAHIAGLEERIAQLAAEHAAGYVHAVTRIEVLVFDIRGDLVGYAEVTR
ncbi:MAG: cobalt-precorrin-5B (C(1))-methyltransferase [Ardenticatenia bacterium]|jgi:cobalt-precorrin-5B (C1)-methyltransferase|nr:MAG: cobalt-precorrin-5B (C(1))-methyltransferase [Ardenticatenia bacterium]